jgi:hypothetical protein
LNFRNLKAVVENPGIVELNVGDEFSYHNENGDTGTLSLSFTGLRGVTLPSREAAGPEGGMFSTQEGVTEIYVQESESEVVQAVMVAQEIAGHALPGLLGQGAAISDRDAHQKREYPARADALINILYWWDFGEHE